MYTEQNIMELKVNSDTLSLLRENNVNTINDIWSLKRTDLKKIGVADSQINHIRIKLQLMGLDLNKKKYKIDR